MPNLLLALYYFLQIYYWILIARILLSWFPNVNWDSQPWAAIYGITEPVMAPFRRLIPPIGGMLDISPILLFIVLNLLMNALSQVISTSM